MDENPKKSSFWKELIKLLLIAFLVVVPFRKFVAQPFIVDGASMDPTFRNGQYLIVDELTYHFKTPERGSVLIFKFPKDTSKYFIKRVIGLPGEIVEIDKGHVLIKNSAHPDGIALNESYIKFEKVDTGVYKLGSNEYFVMGDNRYGSSDSRMWGPVPKEDIVGRPVVRFWPFGILPGQNLYTD
jgi:signal peptidase I